MIGLSKRVARSTFAALGVSVFLLVGCDDPAKNAPKATVGEPAKTASAAAVAPSGAAPATGTVVYEISKKDSSVAFVGSKVTGKHDGSFGEFSGTIQLVDGNVEKSTVNAEILATSVTSDQEKLTTHLKTPDFFDAEKNPKVTFVSTSIKAGGDKGATHTITGNLSLRGMTKSIVFPAKITVAADNVSADAEFSINRKDFGIAYAGKADDLIRDEVLVKLKIRAPKKG